MRDRFEGRVAFVSGAASGLGKATACRLAKEGARLMLFDRDEAGLHETVKQCPGAVWMVGDVTSATDVSAAAAMALEKLGPVELLIPAAGIIGPSKSAIDINEDEWDQLFAINVKGPWLAAKAFIPQMRMVGRGAIVLFSSTAGLVGSPVLPAYSASKGAVSLLGRSLALTHAAENIRVNCICPGTINGPMSESNFAQAGDLEAQKAKAAMMMSKIPLNRFGEPDEIAEAVLYLLSDAAGFTTGVMLPIDGGRLA